jgi:cytochrome c biogenesis protein CcmG, thiol:disulfide interchange protein DsbE
VNRRVAVLALIIAAAIGLYVVAHRRHTAPPFNASNHPAAPAFTLTGLDGQKLDSSSLKGKVVLIDFWATWCAPCRKEIPRFVELQKQYGDQGFQIVGISMDDSAGPVRDFNKEFKLNYPVVMGDDTVADAYGGVLGLPVNILVGRDGHIYAKHAGLTDLQALENEIKAQLAH